MQAKKNKVTGFTCTVHVCVRVPVHTCMNAYLKSPMNSLHITNKELDIHVVLFQTETFINVNMVRLVLFITFIYTG